MQHTTHGLKAAAEMLNNLTEEEIRLAEEIERRQNEFNQVLEFYDEIQKHTGLSLEEIEAFRKEME